MGLSRLDLRNDDGMLSIGASRNLRAQSRSANASLGNGRADSTRERTRRARGGTATQRERRLYTLYRASINVGLIGRYLALKRACPRMGETGRVDKTIEPRLGPFECLI